MKVWRKSEHHAYGDMQTNCRKQQSKNAKVYGIARIAFRIIKPFNELF